MNTPDETVIAGIDAWQVRVPLARPYRLSRVYGTLTHAEAVIVRLTLAGGVEGWGEADPGGLAFTGDTAAMVLDEARARGPALLGSSASSWLDEQRRMHRHGSLVAAIDVACHDALARAAGVPVWKLLGERRRAGIEVLWPTSSGTAEDDLAVIDEYSARGFSTFMLKMGDRPVADDLDRLRAVIDNAPAGVRIMVDANQGWSLEDALTFATGCAAMPLVLIEQPLAAADLDGLRRVRRQAVCPLSVDESLQRPSDAEAVIAADAADVFSIKISKNGGLANAAYMAKIAERAGRRVLMNSMIELGITQAASLHLGCTLDNLLDCGHAYMSTLRMGDDVTDFSDWIESGTAVLPPDCTGLGVTVDPDRIARYEVDAFHVC